MPNDNVLPFRTRAVALSTCALPECDDDYATDHEAVEDPAPVAGGPPFVEILGGEGGNSILDACIPTHVAMAAAAFIMAQLAALPATA